MEGGIAFLRKKTETFIFQEITKRTQPVASIV